MMNIKQIFLLLSVLFSFGSTIAQENEEEILDTTSNTIYVGPFVSMAIGSNIVVPVDGRQNGMAFTSVPSMGFLLKAPLMKTVNLKGVAILGFDNYAFGMKNFNSGENFIHNFSYTTLTAMLDFEGMLFGLTYGIPVSARNGNNIDINIVNSLAELKFGGNFVLIEDESSQFNMNFTFGYMLNDLYNNFPQNDPLKTKIPYGDPRQKVTDEFNLRVASFRISFNYLFNVGKINL